MNTNRQVGGSIPLAGSIPIHDQSAALTFSDLRRYIWSMYPCPSCGFIAFSEPPGSFEICGICGWEDDIVQLVDPTFNGGANWDSLATSQSKILKSISLEVVEHNGFRRDPQWRPLRDEDLRKRSAEEPDYYWLRDEDT